MAKHPKASVEGDWEVSRSFYVPVIIDNSDVEQLSEVLQRIPGVNKVTIDVMNHNLIVRYDVTQTHFTIIVNAMSDAVYPPNKNWWFRIRNAWYQFTENNMRDYAKAPKGACCNKPPMRTKR